MADKVEIIDVGPRDGLQNEAPTLSPARRTELVTRLLDAGADAVEAVSFVDPARVPQMADAEVVLAGIDTRDLDRITALVPNRRGLERALAAGVRHSRYVLAASDAMNRANFGVDTEVSVQRLGPLVDEATAAGTTIGVVIGTAFGCPYEGRVPEARVLEIVEAAVRAGATEIALADTTGMANPAQVLSVCRAVARLDAPRLGCHFHNTRNSGYANVVRALDAGVRRFDSSVGGAGGCPFAPGATGNVATEDLVHLLLGMGLDVRADLGRLIATAEWLESELRHTLPGQVKRAGSVVPAETVA